MRSLARPVPALALATALLAGGCSLSDSVSTSVTSTSNSITRLGDSTSDSSDSASRSSRSSSRSSGSDGESEDLPTRAEWQRDLRAFGVAFVAREDGVADDFLRGIGRVSRAHGVTHWEAAPAILVAVGEGLREAQVSERRVRARLAGLDAKALGHVLAPYGARAD